MAMISFTRRLQQLAEAAPERPAVTCGSDTITRAELVQRGGDLAMHLRNHGVKEGDMVTIAAPNSIDWFVAYAATWRLGAVPQPISSKLPAREIEAIMELANPSAVIGVPADSIAGRWCVPMGFRAPRADASGLPDAVSYAWKAPTSGGSTGRPKLIVSGDPALWDDEAPTPFFLGSDGCFVMPGPLYHNGPAATSCVALLGGNHVVALPRFDAEATLAAVAKHAATGLYLVPTTMKRIWRLPDEVKNAHDLSSLQVMWHMAEPCPEWLKQVWIDWLGAERIFELYAGTEAQTGTVITGPEWLAHRGSVGKPPPDTMMITDADGNEVAVGEQGEVWLRNPRDTPTYVYIGASARIREGGWESLGDMGHVDADGYLYLGDRAADMILCGGANIYPAEVEAAIQEHAGVYSCAVIGLPDDDKGNRVHAIIEADAATFDLDELKSFLAERLVVYKLPRSFEFVNTPLRDDAGKVRRSALRAARLPAA